jgi:Leucine-rich repeat (LRR) protein
MDAGLSRLDVSGNQVASLASLPHLPDLEYLDLSRDQFYQLSWTKK